MPKNGLNYKFYITLIIASCFIFGAWNLMYAANITDLEKNIEEKENEIAAIEKEIEEYKNAINEKEREGKTFQTEIDALNLRVKKLRSDIYLTEQKIERTELSIQELTLEIHSGEQRITTQKEMLAEILRTIYDMETETMVEILLSNDKISDFLGNMQQLSNLDRSLKFNLQELRELKKNLEENRENEIAEENQLLALTKEYASRKIIAEDVKGQKTDLLEQTQEEEAKYQKLLQEREELRAQILAEIAEAEEELRKLIDPSRLPAKIAGVLAWPVGEPHITQSFGYTAFAKSNGGIYLGGGHNGVDFRASIGTPIFAAEDGIVMDIGNTDLSCPGGSYGKWIMIKHENNLATLYAHLSIIGVKKSENVKRGDIIGYSGNTGYVTGPHLHFGVYDANTIRFGPSKSGRCTFLPLGGYLDPMDYL
ncbi:murein hydrolase activator EnvC family protein [Patescibacteria group bacterium]